MTGEAVARVVGRDGEPMWVTFDRDFIAGQFDFEVEAGSTAPVNESFRRQMALQMVDAMAPFASAGIINTQRLAAHVLQFGFGVKSPEEFLQAPPPPMPEEGGMPPNVAAPPMMEPPVGVAGGPMGGGEIIAPPGASPTELSGVDPAVLAALSSRMGIGLPNLGQ